MKKGPLASKRPKSREETPKEGGGNRRKPVAALQQYVIALHQMQGGELTVGSYPQAAFCSRYSVEDRLGSRAPR